MRSVHTVDSTHVHRARTVSACLAPTGTRTEWFVLDVVFTHSPSCIPSLHSHYRSFFTTMNALTPAELSFSRQVSLLHAHSLYETIPSPTTQPFAFVPYSLPKRARPACLGRLPGVRRSYTSLCVRSGSVGPLRLIPDSLRLRHSLAGSSKSARPNRVRHPLFGRSTDWSLTSCCFPPRLLTTQLQSVTSRRTNAWGGFAPP